MEAIRSSEVSIHIRSTRRHIPEAGILHSHRRENVKSYKLYFAFADMHIIFLRLFICVYNKHLQLIFSSCRDICQSYFLTEPLHTACYTTDIYVSSNIRTCFGVVRLRTTNHGVF
jgi:hypothetical protein